VQEVSPRDDDQGRAEKQIEREQKQLPTTALPRRPITVFQSVQTVFFRSAHAKDLGVVGCVHRTLERHLLCEIGSGQYRSFYDRWKRVINGPGYFGIISHTDHHCGVSASSVNLTRSLNICLSVLPAEASVGA